MDPLADPRFFDALARHDELYECFAQRCAATAPRATVDGLPALLGILRDMGRLPSVCSAETEAFLAVEMEAASDEELTFAHVEAYFNGVVCFQSADGLSSEEIAARFPRANAINEDGRPALLAAVDDGDGTLVDMLLRFGADPNATSDGGGTTPLYSACAAAKENIVRSLMLAGADPHARVDRMGATPLYIACHKGLSLVVDELLLGGADPDRPQRDGSTGKHVAAKAAHVEVVRVLLVGRASPDVRTNKGFAPLRTRARGGGDLGRLRRVNSEASQEGGTGGSESGAGGTARAARGGSC